MACGLSGCKRKGERVRVRHLGEKWKRPMVSGDKRERKHRPPKMKKREEKSWHITPLAMAVKKVESHGRLLRDFFFHPLTLHRQREYRARKPMKLSGRQSLGVAFFLS